MDTIYLVSLLVGGFFVLLSIFGGGESDHDVDADAGIDFDHDSDFDFDHDADFDVDHDIDFDAEHDVDLAHDLEAGPGFVDLFSVRALFLFAAFFGLTGLLLTWLNTGEPYTAILAVLTGLIIGLGGNYFIKRIGYAHVSSDVSSNELRGITGKVLIPFEGDEKGKISLIAKGQHLQLVARSFEEDELEPFKPGEEVVVVKMAGSIAEVVKPT